MTLRLIQASLLLVVAACGASDRTAAQSGAAGEAGSRPFVLSEVRTFNSPWAMDFLPGSGVPLTNAALVTEKEGRLWLVNVATGERQQVSGIPQVRVAGQGGLGDVVAHPDFAGNQRIYLSFVEAGPNGTSGAALGYGRLILGSGQPRLQDFKIIWRQEPKVSGRPLPGRKSIAQGASNFMTSLRTNGRPPASPAAPDCAAVRSDAPQAATTNKREACIKRRVIPVVALP